MDFLLQNCQGTVQAGKHFDSSGWTLFFNTKTWTATEQKKAPVHTQTSQSNRLNFQ
jgi:hypothetical protein